MRDRLMYIISKMRTPKMSIGAVIETRWLVSDHLPRTARPASVNPKKVLPASPRKRLADFPNRKLWGKKPIHEPTIATANQQSARTT